MRLPVGVLPYDGDSNTGMLACGGVLTACVFATCTRGGAVIADVGAMVPDGETGTELTWITSSWKSLMLVALSTLAAIGSGVGVFT